MVSDFGKTVLVHIEIWKPADYQINYQVQTRLKYSLASSTSLQYHSPLHTRHDISDLRDNLFHYFRLLVIRRECFCHFVAFNSSSNGLMIQALKTLLLELPTYWTRSMTRDQKNIKEYIGLVAYLSMGWSIHW